MKRLIPVAAYLRASTKKQDTSVPEQKKQLLKFAADNGYHIVAWYIDDGKSGSRDPEKRMDFMRLLADADHAEWDVVLCLDLSRFGRLDNIDGAFAKQRLRSTGIRLHTLIEGEIDWNSSTGRIVDAVLSEAQHEYSFKLGQKTLQGKLTAFLEGRLFGFKTPYGYARKITNPDGQVTIVPRTRKFSKPKGWSGTLIPGERSEVEVVRWLFNEFANKDIGFRALASELNRKGVPSPTGRRWCGKVVQEILKNKKYIGITTLGDREARGFWTLRGKEVVRTNSQESNRSKEPLVAYGTHEAIINKDEFDAVQEKIERRKQTGSHTKGTGGYALKGVLFCGNCNKPLYGNPNGRGNKNSKKSGRVIYVCKQAIKYGKQCSCGQWSVYEDEVLPFLKQVILEGIDRAKLFSVQVLPEKPQNSGEQERRIAKLEEDIRRGTENLLLIPKEHFAECSDQLSTWKTERQQLVSELQAKCLEKKDWKKQWLSRIRKMEEQLVSLQTGVACGGKYSTGVVLHVDAFRELLVSNDCRVDFWWDRASAKRWKVCRVRVQAFGRSTEFESFSSLIV